MGNRVITTTIFFTPPLGLFHILRHYQAEMIGFEQNIGNSALIQDVQRGKFQDYSGRRLFLPPSLELYTVLSLKWYFIIYCVTLMCQTAVIFALDNWWLKSIPANTSLLKRILHAHLKSHFPFPFMDWDSEEGTRENYVLRHKAAQKEVKITTLVNFFFSLLMTFPLTILYGNMYMRHDLLERTIGPLQMEIDAIQTAKWLFLCIPTVVLPTLIQLGFFTLYNGRFHPMSKILDVASTIETKEGGRSQSKYQIVSWITQICSNKPDESKADIELEEKFIEEKSMTENLENEANCLSKLSTKKKEGNTDLPLEQILSNGIPIPVGCDETSSVRKR